MITKTGNKMFGRQNSIKLNTFVAANCFITMAFIENVFAFYNKTCSTVHNKLWLKGRIVYVFHLHNKKENHFVSILCLNELLDFCIRMVPL